MHIVQALIDLADLQLGGFACDDPKPLLDGLRSRFVGHRSVSPPVPALICPLTKSYPFVQPKALNFGKEGLTVMSEERHYVQRVIGTLKRQRVGQGEFDAGAGHFADSVRIDRWPLAGPTLGAGDSHRR